MRRKLCEAVRWLACGLALPLGGCTIAADLVNPNLFAQLGIDPAMIVAQQGVVIIAFNNETRGSATFYAFTASSANDMTVGARNISVSVEPSTVKNEVVECPVGMVVPGSLGTDFTYDSTAVVAAGATTAGTAEQSVAGYAGPPLALGTAFACGDVIEMRLSYGTATGTDQTQLPIVFTVRRVP